MIPVVLIPGHLCGSGWLYAAQVAALEARGMPVRLADTLSDDSVAAMAARLLAAEPGPVIVAGLSMGGMVAMEAMAQAPDRVAGAMLWDTDPFAARPREIEWREAEMAKVRAAGLRVYVEGFAGRFFDHDRHAVARHEAAVIDAMSAVPLPIFEAQARALNTRAEMLERIAGFAAPVAVAVGACDRICPPKLHGPIAGAVADAELVEIPGTGHLATMEAPEAATAPLLRLLERVGAA